MARLAPIAALCVLACLISCERPTRGEIFLASPRNSYDFPVEVEDTLAFFDFGFYTRVDGDSRTDSPVRLDISWVAPNDSLYRETVWMMAGAGDGTLQKYRSYVRFPLSGKWLLKVGVSPEVRGFRGLGLVWEENRWDTIN